MTPTWEPETAAYPLPGTVPVDGQLSEYWVPVDPSSYSDPYAPAPVYTSGPQPIPTELPPPPPPPPAQTPLMPAAPALATAPRLLTEAGPTGGSPLAAGDPMLSPGYHPARGELQLKERRSWKTWQLLTAVVLAAVVGMWISGNSGSASGTGSTARGGGAYKLPPASGSSPTTVPSAARSAGSPSTGSGSTTAGSTTTTAASAAGTGGSSTTTSTVALAPPSVLVPETQQTGNWTSPAFTIAGGTWQIGWAFQCTPPPSATPSFQIFVVTTGGQPGTTPAVTSSAASGNEITPQTSAGSQQLVVQTSAACRWAVKVVGSST